MGGAKKQLMHEQDMMALGEAIAVKAGVLARCEGHEIAYLTGEGEEEAYKLASNMLRNGDLDGVEHRELMDGIKAAIVDVGMWESCSHCARNMERD